MGEREKKRARRARGGGRQANKTQLAAGTGPTNQRIPRHCIRARKTRAALFTARLARIIGRVPLCFSQLDAAELDVEADVRGFRRMLSSFPPPHPPALFPGFSSGSRREWL